MTEKADQQAIKLLEIECGYRSGYSVSLSSFAKAGSSYCSVPSCLKRTKLRRLGEGYYICQWHWSRNPVVREWLAVEEAKKQYALGLDVVGR